MERAASRFDEACSTGALGTIARNDKPGEQLGDVTSRSPGVAKRLRMRYRARGRSENIIALSTNGAKMKKDKTEVCKKNHSRYETRVLVYIHSVNGLGASFASMFLDDEIIRQEKKLHSVRGILFFVEETRKKRYQHSRMFVAHALHNFIFFFVKTV